MYGIKNILTLFFGAIILIIVGSSCENNYPPKIFDKEYARLPGLNSTSFFLRIDARDANQDELTYLWEAPQGEFLESVEKNETTWQGPQSMNDKDYKVFVTVSDGKDFVRDSFLISIAAPTFGKLSGFIYFKDCKIPVSNAIVTVWGKTDTTDIHGAYELDGIMAGRQSITAEKEGFESNTMDILVREGINNTNLDLASTLFTTRLYGQLRGNISGEAKPFLTVVILNPDYSQSKLSAFSDASGNYELPYVPHGLRYLMVKDETSIKMETILYVDTEDYLFNVPIKEPFEFTDTRDQKTYKAVRIGGQIWMMENLAYLPKVSSSAETKGIWVYDYFGTNVQEAKAMPSYKTYGCLYEWTTAVSDSFGNGRDICPPGWHLPSDAEFTLLELTLGMGIAYRDSVGWRLDGTVGRKMKASDGWNDDGNGSNSSSFSALPAGNRTTNRSFVGKGGYTSFWTSTDHEDQYAWRRYLFWNREANGRFTDLRGNAYSVRCVKDN
jgi:uncharacterized protein (TIGR02145 family)